jgi:filamentous hemagglutinin
LSGTTLDPSLITSRELQIAVPTNTTTAQWNQIKRAIQYAQDNGVKIIVTKIKG